MPRRSPKNATTTCAYVLTKPKQPHGPTQTTLVTCLSSSASRAARSAVACSPSWLGQHLRLSSQPQAVLSWQVISLQNKLPTLNPPCSLLLPPPPHTGRGVAGSTSLPSHWNAALSSLGASSVLSCPVCCVFCSFVSSLLHLQFHTTNNNISCRSSWLDPLPLDGRF
jgi:hypothetical protein